MKMLNEKGKACPLPVIEAKKMLEGMGPFEALQVVVDNATAVENLEKLAEQKGYEFSSEMITEGEFRAVFVKGKTSEEAKPGPSSSTDKGTVVAIASETMGTGDERLGKTLMKGFIYALTELDVLPKTVMFYNSGARLTVEGSESLDDLKGLEERGVEIITCGTCLNFYGWTEKLAVGSISNMYTICEKQMEAGKVLRP